MKTEDFNYILPKDLIAAYPKEQRDNSRLLVLDRSQNSIIHQRFYEIVNLLMPGDLLVLNNTKVIPARFYGVTDSGKSVEVLLTDQVDEFKWKVLMKDPKNGIKIKFSQDWVGVISKFNSNDWIIEFSRNTELFFNTLGNMPLPPYIERKPEEKDKSTYQTVYAESEGAIAAPTAGLHFTNELISKIENKGIEIVYITLHVGIGTFRPVKSENINDHKMHEEQIEISSESAELINNAKSSSRRVVAVGTTSVRALESAVESEGKINSGKFSTDLFIYPPYEYKIVDAMITNFHLPRSTLLMLVSAFCGKDFLFHAYNEAIKEEYRFLSYGDAMFIY